jgi:hypothetical protein
LGVIFFAFAKNEPMKPKCLPKTRKTKTPKRLFPNDIQDSAQIVGREHQSSISSGKFDGLLGHVV